MDFGIDQDESRDNGLRVEQAMADERVAAKIARALTALETLVCGRPGSRAVDGEPVFMAGMRLTDEETELLLCAAVRDGRDCVRLAFDVDDLDAAPTISVLRPFVGAVTIEHCMRAWIAPGADRAMLVSEKSCGGYSFRRGARLARAAVRPAARLGAGMVRADARLRRLETAPIVEAELRHAKRVTTTVVGGELQVAAERIAA